MFDLDEPGNFVVIIPCFNEAGRVGHVIRAVKKLYPNTTVVVIDDASKDDSAREAEESGALVISHSVNLGYGAAILTGYLYAIRSGFGIVVQMDGDGQHNASDIPELLVPVIGGEADLVLGSRYGLKDTCVPVKYIRRFGHKLFSGIFFILTRSILTDPTSGFQCFNKKVLTFYAKSRFPHDFPDLDVLMMAQYAGLRIKEIEVTMMPRIGGRSMHSGLRPVYYLLKIFVSILVVTLMRKEWKKYVT